MRVLFTQDELATLLGSDVPTDTYNLVHGLIEGQIEELVGPLGAHTSTVVLPVENGDTVRLPWRAVSAVSAVTVDGVAVDFIWDQPVPRLRLSRCTSGPVTVTATYGTSWISAATRAVALAAAARAIANPQGVRSESIDDYSVTYADGAEPGRAGVHLTQAEVDALTDSTAYVTG